jgi:hypothetical protein
VLEPDYAPTIHDWSDGAGGGFQADAYGGAGGAEAVFITDSAKTVSVLTVGGYAHAEWPREWGEPQTVEFYDTAGNLVTELEFLAHD